MPGRRLLPAVALTALAAVCAGFGIWQIQRARQDDDLARLTAERSREPPVELPGKLPPDADLPYRRAVARGRFEPADRLFIDGRPRDGALGVHLLVPLRLAGSDERVLVNRGWFERGAAPATGTDEMQVNGLLVRPAEPPLKLAGPPGAEKEGHWPYLDLARFRRSHPYPVAPFVLIEEPRLAQESLAAQLQGANRFAMHIGYVVQWFAFAAIALFLAGRRLISRKEPIS